LDIPRAPKKKTGRYAAIAGGVVVLLGASVALTRLEPAAPTAERATLWIDTVRRGTMVRQVRAPGTLVPERIRWISALTAGRIEQLVVRPGTQVTEGTVLLEMSNPDVQLEALDAERQLASAEAQLAQLRTQLETSQLQQQAAVATISSEFNDAKRNAEVFEALDRKGLSSTNEVERARDRARELASRREIEQRRLRLSQQTIRAQLAPQEQNVQRLRAIVEFQRNRVNAMKVVAGEDGVLQDMNLELGQWVVPGQVLARVAQPGRLKAVLRVPETQAKDIAIGQPAAIDTRTGGNEASVVRGKVMRVDPAVQNGTVQVEVALEGTLPRGARTDLSVDGTIEIERLTNVMYVGRPAYGQAESTVGLFRLDPDGATARRVQARLGRSSVNTIEVVQGLNVGDKVIVSDVSQWDGSDRLRVK
jgi:multidrug resistance efflux pump